MVEISLTYMYPDLLYFSFAVDTDSSLFPYCFFFCHWQRGKIRDPGSCSKRDLVCFDLLSVHKHLVLQ